jgi:uncharacterized protein
VVGVITIEEARRHYKDNDPAHDFDHVLRVLALAERIARAEGADAEIVRASALLHDVGRAEQELTGRSHAVHGAERARDILAGHPPEKVHAVCEAIASHRFREDAPPQTLEAEVLYDADKLDSIGAVGIARAYLYGGLCRQRLWAEVPAGYQARGELPEEHTPVHEFVFKLSKLKDTLYTNTARRIGQERHAYMVEFFERLEREVRGEA